MTDTSPAAPAPSGYVDPLVGEVIADRYVLTRVIGTGGMGRVYEAQHLVVRNRVAVKMLHPHLLEDQNLVERFVAEARTAGSFGHPNIAHCLDAGHTAEGVPFLVLEYLEGHTVSRELSGRTPVDVARVVRIIGEVAQALDAAHAHGIVHRDVKPGNIFIARNPADGSETAKLLDFGIAKIMDATTQMTRTGELFGSGHYIAPEQLKKDAGGVGPKADIYALGMVAHELLTGRRAWKDRDMMAIVAEIAGGRGPVLPSVRDEHPEVPAHVARTVSRALERDPNERWASAGEFARALVDPDMTRVARRWPRGVTIWVAAALLAVVGTAGWLLTREPAGPVAGEAASKRTTSGVGAGTEPAGANAPVAAPAVTPAKAEPAPVDAAASAANATPAEPPKAVTPAKRPRPRKARRARTPPRASQLMVEDEVPLFRSNK